MRAVTFGAMVAALLLAAVGLEGHQWSNAEAAFPGSNGKIAFVRQLELAQGWGEIFVMDADGSNQTQISNHPGFDEWPRWSPDGQKIAFERHPVSGTGSPADIWVMNPDGTAQVNLTNTPDVNDTLPSWSPDRTRIVFTSEQSLKVLNVQTLALTDLGISGHSPAWSPDGGRIAYIGFANPPGIQNVYIMNADG